MKSKENLVFLGMMGAGKTSIGSIVSKKLNLDFFDIDHEIERNNGMKIFKIFGLKGESFFREIEERTTLNILKKKKCVISLGGGAFLNKNIKKEILDNHLSFWLNWDIKTLISRIQKNKKRPIAFNSTKNELIEIIKKRSIIYSKANYKIDCENFTKQEIAKQIINIYETY